MSTPNSTTSTQPEFIVLNMQTDLTTGWAARAMRQGLRVSSHTGPFGDENFLVKDGRGNHIKVTQNTQRARKLNGSAFTPAQVAIAEMLMDCGLIRRPGKS